MQQRVLLAQPTKNRSKKKTTRRLLSCQLFSVASIDLPGVIKSSDFICFFVSLVFVRRFTFHPKPRRTDGKPSRSNGKPRHPDGRPSRSDGKPRQKYPRLCDKFFASDYKTSRIIYHPIPSCFPIVQMGGCLSRNLTQRYLLRCNYYPSSSAGPPTRTHYEAYRKNI